MAAIGDIDSSMLKLDQSKLVSGEPKSGSGDIDIPKTSEENQLDAIIVEIGQFGHFQVFNYLLLCLPIICNAFYSISYVFTASDVPHRWVSEMVMVLYFYAGNSS